MTFVIVISILFFALVLSAFFSYGLKIKGPWGSFWTFFIVLALGILVASIWIQPMGPVMGGVAWLQILVVGILLALLLAAATPTASRYEEDSIKSPKSRDENKDTPLIALGAFFWIMILIFAVAALAGIFFT